MWCAIGSPSALTSISILHSVQVHKAAGIYSEPLTLGRDTFVNRACGGLTAIAGFIHQQVVSAFLYKVACAVDSSSNLKPVRKRSSKCGDSPNRQSSCPVRFEFGLPAFIGVEDRQNHSKVVKIKLSDDVRRLDQCWLHSSSFALMRSQQHLGHHLSVRCARESAFARSLYYGFDFALISAFAAEGTWAFSRSKPR